MAYSYMYMANEETPVNVELNLPKLQFNWQKLLKSSAWLTLAGVTVLLAAASQIQQASAEYVRTNGSCLYIRRGPSSGNSSVACVPNGTNIGNTGNVRNGYAQITSGRYQGNYVAERWISMNRGTSPRSHGSGVGGRVFLRPGARGERVRIVQRALGIRVDGVYGPETTRQVRNFQRRNNLLVDGVVGPATRGALGIS
ncbi:peptidoglycan-binding domain-containing protein [Anabaena sp. UHCC 0451]|uniref:peptidoglycan-binding domain-containing protein n=1 Tax=Anabaena sp. UHCC 0451 TaxID=2055235 RepID=UPI002B1F5A73|nr:peptidoglycan-binding domain-containing protein [Anabaena sp. UHCC 0451]MEA5577817.1 peptidoglycan-binding domain-containing protein [Anabaena sp. UHCC 0451]